MVANFTFLFITYKHDENITDILDDLQTCIPALRSVHDDIDASI